MLIFLSGVAFISSVSCTGRFDQKGEAAFIENLYKGGFSKALNPGKKLLKKLNNTDLGALYYTGLYLKKEHPSSAMVYFQYAAENSPPPYNLLAEKELYSLYSNEEKCAALKKILSSKTESKEAKDKAAENLRRLSFLRGNFEGSGIDLPSYLASVKIDIELQAAFQKLNEAEQKPYPEDFYTVTEARILISKSQFAKAWLILKPLLEEAEKHPYLANRLILSDLGKAAVSGSNGYKEDIRLFEQTLTGLEKKKDESAGLQKYMYAFYTARLYQKAGGKNNITAAIELFKKAASYAPSDQDYDAAIWRSLDLLKHRAFALFFEELCAAVPRWKNAFTYEDLVSYAAKHLIETRNTKDLNRLYEALLKTPLAEAEARHAYLLARFESLSAANAKTEKLYTDAVETKHNFLYYRILSAYKLKKPLGYSLYRKKTVRKPNTEINAIEAMQVLNGLLKYKLYGEVYGAMLRLYPDIKLEKAAALSAALAEREEYADSMRIITYAVNSEGEAGEEHLKLMYPRPWNSSVRKYAAEYGVPEYVMYALIRSESYFRPAVISRAGAVGLAQLMKPTAAEIARRLKLNGYSLNDPDTNIRFGAYYICDMIKRNGGKILPALFSYNAGPNAVKRWVKQKGKTPDDLFLETLPYAETRGYGRNLLSASVIYGMLYYGKKYTDIVEEFFPNFKEEGLTSPAK